MKRLLWAWVLLAGCSSAEKPAAQAPAASPAPARVPVPGVPAALAVDGVPPVPPEVTARLAQYQSARNAFFEDWGPDGSMLISTRFAETAQLHLVPFPGGRREQLTFSDEPVSTGLFIPGSSDLLYTQSRGGNENWQIYRLNRKSGTSTLLSDGKSRNSLGPLSSKGDRIVYSSNRRNGKDMDLNILDLKTGASTTLLETKGEFWTVTDWSPDDRALALLKIVSVAQSVPAMMGVEEKSLHPVFDPGLPPAAYGNLRFANDRHQMVLTRDVPSEFRQLLQIDLSISSAANPKTVRLDRPWDVVEIEVHGEHIAYVKNEDGVSRLYFLGQDEPVNLPIGVLSGLKYSPDGRRLGFTLSRADAPADAYSYEIAEKNLVRWTYSETGGLDPTTFVTPQRISYKSFDGLEIPAYVYTPRNPAKAPVVISIHGGPEAQYQPFFSPLIQYWVNELGLAVIAPNVRGSTGYGRTFTSLDNAEKREDSVKDIGALLDWIATQPNLDASRVAVHGVSYGGYMVLASLVHFGDRIKAGVDFVGIANFTSFLEKTSGYRVDLRRVEYGDERDPKMRDVFERISPANHADRIRSALLVAHGRNDPRVPFAEAEQIAAKVRAQGRPVWTVYADNEGHGFARKENRDYFTAATTLFFQKHLLQ
jgi:dipeptidyl aminopeptidase/acylaminoacyl peptidase